MTLPSPPIALLLSLALFMAPPPASGADPLAGRTPPGSVPGFAKALAHFDLEIPVADGSGVVKITTLTSEPAKGFAAAPGYATYFWAPSATEMIFRVPPNGATTPNSHFPRTELNQKKAERWKTAGGNHTLRGIFTVASVPKVTDKGEITVAQIHDDISDHGPLLKLICDYKSRPWKLFAEYRIEPQKTSAIVRTADRQRESITLNTPLEYEILLTSAQVLTVKARKPGTQTWKVLADSAPKGQSLDPAWDAETCYFKAGCYMFDPSLTEAPVAEVHYTALAVEWSDVEPRSVECRVVRLIASSICNFCRLLTLEARELPRLCPTTSCNGRSELRAIKSDRGPALSVPLYQLIDGQFILFA